MLYFTGHAAGGNNILNWETSAELNFSYFDVLRSKDNNLYEKLTSVNGKGQNGLGANYVYVDENPFLGINYYKLKMVDINGKSEFSNEINLFVSKDFSFGLYPNPASHIVTVSVTGATEGVGFLLSNALGQELYKYNWAEDGNNVHDIDISSFSKGVYFYQIDYAGQSYKGKLIKE